MFIMIKNVVEKLQFFRLTNLFRVRVEKNQIDQFFKFIIITFCSCHSIYEFRKKKPKEGGGDGNLTENHGQRATRDKWRNSDRQTDGRADRSQSKQLISPSGWL